MARVWSGATLSVAMALAGSFPAHAQLTAKAEAGVVAARGNTDTDSANAKFEIQREFVAWKHALGLAGVYASDETGATGQRWDARAQTDYKFHPKGFWFGSGRYEEDRFSGFEYQWTLGTGLGWRFYDDDITKLIAQIGAGYKNSRTRLALADDLTPIPSELQEELIGTASVNFDRVLTDTTRVLNKFLLETGDENTFIQNDLSLEVRIMSRLALALGYSVRYNSDPPPGFERTDTLTTLNLVYELK